MKTYHEVVAASAKPGTVARFRNSNLALILILILSCSPLSQAGMNSTAVQPSGAHSTPITYTSHGSILSFRPDRVVASNGRYALQVAFQNANAIVPTSQGNAAAKAGQLAPLGRVTYSDLWDGVTLVYQPANDGIFESTYVVAPHANPAAIHLRYNAPVAVSADGSLTISFVRGRLAESAPVAWQVKNGTRLPVAISFSQSSNHEISFALGYYDHGLELHLDPTLVWNTYLGGTGHDEGHGIALDGSGNIYVVGGSDATWGSPRRAFAGTNDVFVAKLAPSGDLLWNTFLGSGSDDESSGIAVGQTGDVYVEGYSAGTWGSPIRAFISSPDDAFTARLDTNGNLLWNTFLGGSGRDFGEGIAIDGSENVYLVGQGDASWGNPVRLFSPGVLDAFAAKMDSNGNLLWNTFLGNISYDDGRGVAVDGAGNVYVAGTSSSTWGMPIHAISSGLDAFVAKLDSNGSLLWNTFMGGASSDFGTGIAIDGARNLFVVGYGDGPWGNPVRPYTQGSGDNIFIAKLDPSGTRRWNTFLGGSQVIQTRIITVDGTGYVYVAGVSPEAWGCALPFTCTVNAYSGDLDIFAAKLEATSGNLRWDTFLGSTTVDFADGVAVDPGGNVYLAGGSDSGWGFPTIRDYSAGYDAVVAKLDTNPHQITGNAGVAGATLTYTDGIKKTKISQANGSYSLTVSYDWSGTVVPSKPGFGFSPAKRAYTYISSNKTGQNYMAYSPGGTIAPTGATDLRPPYIWTKIAGATQYKFQLSKQGGTAIKAWTAITPSCGTITCSYNPGLTLAYSTAYQWQLQALINGTWRSYGPFPFTVVLMPKPGFWRGQGGGLSFYVTPDRAHVTQFKATFLNVCGKASFTVTNSNSLLVSASHQFSFTGKFYGNGKFALPTSASGTAGYVFSGPTCNTGALPWAAIWVNSNQPQP